MCSRESRRERRERERRGEGERKRERKGEREKLQKAMSHHREPFRYKLSLKDPKQDVEANYLNYSIKCQANNLNVSDVYIMIRLDIARITLTHYTNIAS